MLVRFVYRGKVKVNLLGNLGWLGWCVANQTRMMSGPAKGFFRETVDKNFLCGSAPFSGILIAVIAGLSVFFVEVFSMHYCA